MTTQMVVNDYLQQVSTLLEHIDAEWIDRLVENLLSAWHDGKRVLLMGNGGSSSSVSHIVADMQKNIQLSTGKALRTLCLTDSTPLMSAWANDTAWHNVFAPQVECWAEPGDVVIGVSGSGNSMNIINGIEAANRMGAHTYGLAGFAGGKLKLAAQHCLVVESDNMQRIEDVHMILLHIIFLALEKRALAEQAATAIG